MNAFQMLRPRGADTAPAKVPKKPKKAPVPITYSEKIVRVMNVNGKLQASLEPDASRSIVIESRAQAQASTDKTRRISRSGVQ